MAVGTVSGNNFRHYDITHKSKRKQSEIETENNSSADSSTVNVTLSSIPQGVTLESAITYFKENASGANENLFKATVKWLTEYREILNEQKKDKSVSRRADYPVDNGSMQYATEG